MKVGVVGAGTIVPDFLRAQSHIDGIEVRAISGMESDRKRMEELSEEYRIGKIFFDYNEMFDSGIDTVYVAVPNSLHFSVAKAALEHNLNVILEKPFTSNYNEALSLIEYAREKQLFLFDAVSTLYYPNYLKIKELIEKLGDIRIVEINYSQYSRRYDQFKAGITLPVFDPKKAGGALMDLNVYNVNFVIGLFGKPLDVHYYANIEKGIDTSGILVLEYASFKCVLIAAKDCKARCSISIQGDKAFISSDSPANILTGFSFSLNSGEKTDYQLGEYGIYDRMTYELTAFSDALDQKDYTFVKRGFEHTLDVIEVLDKARRQAGIKFE